MNEAFHDCCSQAKMATSLSPTVDEVHLFTVSGANQTTDSPTIVEMALMHTRGGH